MGIKVAINGYGTIGKRVAHAVRLQNDMEVVGVTKRHPTFEARMAVEMGFPFYAVTSEHISGFEEMGIPVQGTLEDLLGEAEVVIDCTPGKVGATNAPLYAKHGVKAIFQGGEKHEIAGISFNAMANYERAVGATRVRVVSCNTTGLCRTLYPLDINVGIVNVLATMIRRSADPWDSKKGPINAIEPSLKVPSHHGPDLQTIMPHIQIQTLAVKVPTTIMHLHAIAVKLRKPVNTEDVLDIWKKTPRVKMVRGREGIKSTAQVMEMARDFGRNRGDFYEIAVWEDGMYVVGDMLYYYQAIHQEADVVPENVDAIRAMFEIEHDKMKSIEKTDKSLGIG